MAVGEQKERRSKYAEIGKKMVVSLVVDDGAICTKGRKIWTSLCTNCRGL